MTLVNEPLSLPVPSRAPTVLHPTPSLAVRVALDRVADVYTLSIALSLVGKPRSLEPHSATQGTVPECIDEVVASISDASLDRHCQLLRGRAVAAVVGDCLRRALLRGSPG